jgi:predicted nucleic acid-binding protein
MPAALFDTSIYISAFRVSVDPVLSLRRLAEGASLWLSAVVLEELYAGAKPRDFKAIERLERDFGRASRILVPNQTDWSTSGKVLGRLAAKYGFEQVGKARLTNDALVAMSAARRGITVLTANERAFARLAEFRAFSWRVTTFPRP